MISIDGPAMRLPPLHSLSRRRRSSHATVYRSLASSAGRTAITDATHVRIRRAVVLAASPLCQPPRRRWPGLCLDGALHGEVDAGHRTRSHPWRGAGHDGALRDEVVVRCLDARRRCPWTRPSMARCRSRWCSLWRGHGRLVPCLDGALHGEVVVAAAQATRRSFLLRPPMARWRPTEEEDATL